MKKKLFVTLGICLLSFPLSGFAEDFDYQNNDDGEEILEDTNLLPQPIQYSSTSIGNKFKIKKEIAITNKENDASTNGKNVKLTATSLNLHGAANYENYLRFSDIKLPEDAVLKKATLAFTAKSSSKKSTNFTVQGEVGENLPFSSNSDSFSNRRMSQNTITVQTPNNVSINDTLETGDLLPIIQEMLNNDENLNNLVFKLTGNNEGKYIAKTFESGSEFAPKLVLDYESAYNNISIPIQNSDDTAKEIEKTKKVTTTGNLEFGGHKGTPTQSNKQSIALRFNQVDIPENAYIKEAYIEFVTSAKSTKDVASNLSIRSELGDATSFIRQDGNISDRVYGKLAISSKMNSFKEKNKIIRTSDLSNLINENRLFGWQTNQSLVFKIDGDNYLGSVYSNNKLNSPRLVVTYKYSDTPLEIDDVITNNKDIENIFINEVSTQGTTDSKASWIELFNKNDKPVLLNKNISLVSKKKQFDLVGLIIPAHGYRIIYMDGKNDLGNDHSTFELSNSGNLSLIDTSNNEKRVIDSIDYDKQAYNQTIGRVPDGSDTIRLINEPTFEGSNDHAKVDTSLHFSQERGVYPSGFDLKLNVDPSLSIRYTTDGTDPTPTVGNTYNGPIKVNKTMVVKAIAFNDNTQTNVVAHSYILENNLPNEVKKGSVWQYKDSINTEDYAKGMKQFPIISVTGNRSDLTKNDDTIGTFEYIDAHTSTSHGNYFSPVATKKYGQVSSNQYNSGVAVKFNRNALTKKAKYEFFEPVPGDTFKPVKKFAKLQMKEGQDGPQNDIYGLGFNRYDEKVTNTLAKQMGKLGLGSRYVHYFYNGRYFGVKTLRENFSEKMFEEYFGGNDTDYTKIRFQDAAFSRGNVEDKTSTVWPVIQKSIKNNDFQEAKKYINFDDLIDTQILFMFVDTEREIDAVVQNSVVSNDSNAVKMRFNVNDTDGAFHNNKKTGTGQAPLAGGGGTYRYKWNSDAISKRGAGTIFGTFSGNSTNDKLGNLEFKTMVKDHVAQQFGTFDEDKSKAPLTVENVGGLIRENIAELDAAYKLDAAFMGARKNMYQEWVSYQDKVFNQLPDRVSYSQDMWKKYNLTHTLDPVQLVEKDNQLLLFNSSQKATIYYTTDGTDPMGADGTISKSAIKYSKDTLPTKGDKLTIRAFEPNNWGPKVVK
ncbi:FN3 associated domain-containing protein [Vagococcus sp.]|uniref:FN3 associated domain-containing protein n=1 Tax=Vagococcus sp. TaxID=1933889 RepID=UPI002FC671EF